MDPEDAVPQDVGIEDSHIQFTFASSQGAVTTENIGPADFELLEKAIAAVAEQKTSHLVISAPPRYCELSFSYSKILNYNKNTLNYAGLYLG